jgi:multimeric flavodoxin WrbA
MTMSTARKRVLVLCGSPRSDGNSALLGRALAAGAESAGHVTTVAVLDDYLKAFLGDCRRCRRPDGSCGIADDYAKLYLDLFLPADAVAFASPIFWYGVSAQTKAFLDRTFCYYAASHPDSARHIAGMTGKRLALLLASEESYPGASLGIVHQFQEYARYTCSELVGIVRGVGNRRGDVHDDPQEPLAAARRLGAGIFEVHYSDYRIDTLRGGSVWGGARGT